MYPCNAIDVRQSLWPCSADVTNASLRRIGGRHHSGQWISAFSTAQRNAGGAQGLQNPGCEGSRIESIYEDFGVLRVERWRTVAITTWQLWQRHFCSNIHQTVPVIQFSPLTSTDHNFLRIHFRKQPVCASFISLTRHSPMIPGPFSQDPRQAFETLKSFNVPKPATWSRTSGVQSSQHPSSAIIRPPLKPIESGHCWWQGWHRHRFSPEEKKESYRLACMACVDVLLVWHHSSTSDFKGHYDGNLFHICLDVFPGIVTTCNHLWFKTYPDCALQPDPPVAPHEPRVTSQASLMSCTLTPAANV